MVAWEDSASPGEAFALSLVSMNTISWNAGYAKQNWTPFFAALVVYTPWPKIKYSIRTFLGSARFDNGYHPIISFR
jgi:hypothetical protein